MRAPVETGGEVAGLGRTDGRRRDIDDKESWRPGDLLFFGDERVDHVGLLLAEGEVLHASGSVKVDFLAPDASLKGRKLLAVVDPLDLESFM